jgi:hypothetical protein
VNQLSSPIWSGILTFDLLHDEAIERGIAILNALSSFPFQLRDPLNRRRVRRYLLVEPVSVGLAAVSREVDRQDGWISLAGHRDGACLVADVSGSESRGYRRLTSSGSYQLCLTFFACAVSISTSTLMSNPPVDKEGRFRSNQARKFNFCRVLK